MRITRAIIGQGLYHRVDMSQLQRGGRKPKPLNGTHWTQMALIVFICATVKISDILNGHGFQISEYIRDYTKLQEGPLCARSREC